MYTLFLRIISITLLLALFVSTTGFSSQPELPDTQDSTHIDGVDGSVVITRDIAGVAHIRASTERDAQFGLGYTHAQDRLWQMEWQRRLASGRISELLGDKGLKADVLFRTVGIRRAAEAAWANLPADDRQPLEAYVAGVNTYLANLPSQQLPPNSASCRCNRSRGHLWIYWHLSSCLCGTTAAIGTKNCCVVN